MSTATTKTDLFALYIWVGSTGSGKTEAAMDEARRLERLGAQILLVRPTKSRRAHEPEGWLVCKGNGSRWPAVEADLFADLLSTIEEMKPDYLWIEEPALFDEELKAGPGEAPLFDMLVPLRNRLHLMLSGISATSEGEIFSLSVAKLLGWMPDRIYWIRADCDDCATRKVGSRSFFISGEEKTGKVKVGGEDDYCSLCWECWNHNTAARARGETPRVVGRILTRLGVAAGA